MSLVVAYVPLVAIVVIVALIARPFLARVSFGSVRRRMTPVRRAPKPRGVVLPFDRTKLDEDLQALLKREGRQ